MASVLRPALGRTLAYTSSTRLSNRATSLAQTRCFQTSITQSKIPDFGFAFDIDGVLVRSSTPIPGAHEALSYLQSQRIPFVLLTNGGGKTEAERVNDLQDRLNIPLDTGMFVQSHTPFADLTQYHDKTVLVVGGEYDKCQRVAQGYGYKNVVTPADLYCAYPEIWPFGGQFEEMYKTFAKPLPKPIVHGGEPGESLKIDAIFVYNDPRDWGLDSQIMLDVLLSRQGVLGTLSSKNGDKSLPNDGYLQDGQPPLYYSNPDLWWAASYPLNRLGQGAFQNAFEGLWSAVTGGANLDKTIIGKPSQHTYEFSENLLRQHRKTLWGSLGLNDPLRRVYMIGDNPESDIRGANNYRSPHGSEWTSILVKTGVYREGQEPSCKPHIVRENVLDAVEWAVDDAQARMPHDKHRNQR